MISIKCWSLNAGKDACTYMGDKGRKEQRASGCAQTGKQAKYKPNCGGDQEDDDRGHPDFLLGWVDELGGVQRVLKVLGSEVSQPDGSAAPYRT